MTSFSFAVLGISFCIIHELLTPWSLSLMVWYWLLMLVLFLTTIISLISLVFVNRKNHNFTVGYRNAHTSKYISYTRTSIMAAITFYYWKWYEC